MIRMFAWCGMKASISSAVTPAASIPIATQRLLDEGQVSSGALALQIGFGAGLVYAAQVVVLP